MEDKRVVEIKGIEMEVDMRTARRVDTFKVGDNVKVLEDFKNDMPILGVEESRIAETVRKKGVKCLGGKDSNAYKEKLLRGKVYQDIYRELKRQFGVATYKAIKGNQCETAIHIIEVYKLPIALAE